MNRMTIPMDSQEMNQERIQEKAIYKFEADLLDAVGTVSNFLNENIYFKTLEVFVGDGYWDDKEGAICCEGYIKVDKKSFDLQDIERLLSNADNYGVYFTKIKEKKKTLKIKFHAISEHTLTVDGYIEYFENI